jgi:hypothetical protein
MKLAHNASIKSGYGYHSKTSLKHQLTIKVDAGETEQEIEERPDFRFENGAVYRGQWKGNDRHGFG